MEVSKIFHYYFALLQEKLGENYFAAARLAVAVKALCHLLHRSNNGMGSLIATSLSSLTV